MFFTSICITHGMTHIIMMGNMTISFGRNVLRRICRISFCIRYLSVISRYSNLVLNIFSDTASSTAAMMLSTATSFITSPMPTPMIISLRMASI